MDDAALQRGNRRLRAISYVETTENDVDVPLNRRFADFESASPISRLRGLLRSARVLPFRGRLSSECGALRKALETGPGGISRHERGGWH
jgi:hypothetical protein